MKKRELAKQRRVKALQKEPDELGPVMRGSVVVIGTRNKQPCLSLNKNKKTQLIYLGKKREDEARSLTPRQYSDNYKRLREIVEEMTQLNMTLLKEKYDL